MLLHLAYSLEMFQKTSLLHSRDRWYKNFISKVISFSKMNDESSIKEGSCKIILKIIKSLISFFYFHIWMRVQQCSSRRSHQFLYEIQEEPSPDFTLSTENLMPNVSEDKSPKIFNSNRLLDMAKNDTIIVSIIRITPGKRLFALCPHQWRTSDFHSYLQSLHSFNSSKRYLTSSI